MSKLKSKSELFSEWLSTCKEIHGNARTL